MSSAYTLTRNFIWIIGLIIIMFLGMGGVAFITLLERKILSLSQIRLGPSKVTLSGLLQPLSDGIKLLFKETLSPSMNQSWLYALIPMSLLLFFLIMWSIVLVWSMVIPLMSVLLLLSVLGMGTYLVMLSGWSPTSVFSKLGSLRSMLQGLSFEVALVLILLSICLAKANLSLLNMGFKEELSMVWLTLWTIMLLMDTNRAPFDLLEGESELISGFNIEMSALLFVYIFLSEYGMIMVASFLGSLGVSGSMFLYSLFLMMLMLMTRSCYPRLRYDLISGIMWKSGLIIGLFSFMLYLSLKL